MNDDKNNIEAWKNIILNNELELLDILRKLLVLDTTDFEKIIGKN